MSFITSAATWSWTRQFLPSFGETKKDYGRKTQLDFAFTHLIQMDDVTLNPAPIARENPFSANIDGLEMILAHACLGKEKTNLLGNDQPLNKPGMINTWSYFWSRSLTQSLEQNFSSCFLSYWEYNVYDLSALNIGDALIGSGVPENDHVWNDWFA